MSAELMALLDAIRANPEDDLPRLALADWCLEQPDEALQGRGEFIHMRCRAALLPPSDPQRAALERAALQLLRRHETTWLGGLDKVASGWEFERGMILVEVTHGSLRRSPLQRLAKVPGWVWVIGLRGLLLEGDDIRRVVSSPLLNHLTSLDLSDCHLGPAGAQVLSESPHTAWLSRLALGYCQIGDEGAIALASTVHPARLTVLSLFNNRIGRDGCVALAGSARLSRVTSLDLSRNPLGDEGARAVAGSPHLAELVDLRLASCGISDRGGVALASASRLDGLRHLDLSDNRFRPQTIEELRDRFGARIRL